MIRGFFLRKDFYFFIHLSKKNQSEGYNIKLLYTQKHNFNIASICKYFKFFQYNLRD